MPSAPLVEELAVRIVESRIPPGPPSAVATGHDQAKKALEPILDRQLQLYQIAPLPNDGPLVESAVSRYYWHHGFSCYNSALATLAADPTAAANDAIAAAQAFQQAGDSTHSAEAEQMARNLQVRRACWLCHREMQGLGTNINWYPSAIAPYVASMLRNASQDDGNIDVTRDLLVLCTPCAAMVEKRADYIAQMRVQEVRLEFNQRLDQLQAAISELARKAHTH
jgi:hypothetical protein